MRTLILDTLGLAGFGALNYGIFLKFGLAESLICAGLMLLLASLAGARAAKHSRSGGKS